jgi:hypothetical protein
MTISFGRMNDHYTKPMPNRKITELSFAYISNDLYKIEEFVEKSLGFCNVNIGNRGFKLFDEAEISDI